MTRKTAPQTTKDRPSFTIEPLGDRALVLYFEPEMSVRIHEEIMSWVRVLSAKPVPFQAALIPSYATLSILFSQKLTRAGFQRIQDSLKKRSQHLNDFKVDPDSRAMVVEIPVVYGGEKGPDLDEVAKLHRLSPKEVIRIHTEPIYEVYQVGFTPGFPYLGGLSPQIRTPRLPQPRVHVKAGSVGIGDAQTGVYTVDGPGGWRIIGRTELKFFDQNLNSPSLLKAGMKVKFVEVKS